MVADAQHLALGLLQHSPIATRFVERAVVCGHWAMPNSMVLFDSGRNGTRVRLLDISIWTDSIHDYPAVQLSICVLVLKRVLQPKIGSPV